MNNQEYDLINDRIFVRGFEYSNKNKEYVKILKYPRVFKNIYTISEDGKIYSMMSDEYLVWGYRNNLPFVNLCCNIEDGKTSIEPFYIKDLIAYNYIANADNYLERGYESIYIDGNPKNNNYQNIKYIPTTFKSLNNP